MFIIALVLGCAHVAQAHNWVYSVSRSFNQASTYKPCRPRVNDAPHWQINQGQTFNMEWATGHDHWFYFTIVNSKDMEQLNNVTERDLNDYLKDCQATDDYMRSKSSALVGVNPQYWEKQHIENNPANFDQKGLDGNNIYELRLNVTDARYIPRHPKFQGGGNVRWAYTQPNLVGDLRCSYFNSKYPFLIAVHRFVQVETAMSRAGDRDIARFTIELSSGHTSRGYGQGSYIVQYLWRGYFDCADVDLFIGTTVDEQLIGGRPLLATEPQWNKIDHCLFEETQMTLTNCMEVVTDAKTVLDNCQRDDDCQGVNVVPLWNPNDVFPLFSNRVAIPWDGGRCNLNLFASLSKGTRVAYGVQPRLPNNTHSMYSVTDDPEDPLFFSTCFIRKPQWKFDLTLEAVTNSTPTVIPPPWAFSDRCVDCNAWKAAQESDDVPVWTLPQHCRNCETSTLPPVPVLSNNVLAKGQKCDGSWINGRSVWNFATPSPQCAAAKCMKTLNLVGTNVITATQCIAKAKLDPECSEHVMHREQTVNNQKQYGCECWTKTNPGCCGVCKPVDFYADNWAVKVYSTATPEADPTCANGIKSADGAHCCPQSCGQCLGKPVFQVSFRSGTLVAPPGWAVDNGARYGARTNEFPQPLSSTYGWNCDLTTEVDDRNTADGTDFHSTVVRSSYDTCGNVIPEWNLAVQNTTYEVHVLYSRPNQQIGGCKLQGQANYDAGFTQLSSTNMAWVARSVNVTTGKITWTAANNAFACPAISALRVYPSTTTPVVDCRKLDGMCCPQSLEMAARPCSAFSAPCSL